LARDKVKTLYDISSLLFQRQNVSEALIEVVATAAEALGAQAGALVQRQPASGSPAEVVAWNLPEQALRNRSLATELLVSLGLQDSTPVVINDYDHYVFVHSSLVDLGVKSLVASAILSGEGGICGLLILFALGAGKLFTKRDAELVRAIAAIVSLRLENLRLTRLGRMFKDEMQTVQRASSALSASLELPKVLDSILVTAHELVPADLAHIFLYADQKLVFGAASGADGRWEKPYAEPRPEGVTYRVARTGEPIVVEDIRTHPLYREAPKNWQGSLVSLPLKIKQRVVGVMNISSLERRPFNEEHLRILEMLADQAAIAVENARLYQIERTQRQRLEALRSAVATLSQSLELSEVLDRILTELRKVIPYDSASVMLMEGENLRVVAGRDLPGGGAIGDRYPITEIEREIEKTGRPFLLVDASRDDRFKGWGDSHYVRGWMSVPLLGAKGMIGCLAIDSRQLGAYSQEQAELAMSFAHQAAIAVENAQLHQSVKDQLEALQASQSKLVQSEKLAAIGKLVAGVAHELNNPLTAIIGIAQLLQSGEAGEAIRQALERLVGEAHRAGKIVRSLLDFSRQQRPERKPVLINDVIRSTLNILSYELKANNIDCRTELAGELPAVWADADQLQQVFVNLITNAGEAMVEANGGGTLFISSELVVSAEDGGHSHQQFVRVAVEDDGPGIPAEVLPRIFDPFFTTKSPGRGTGLGLSVCHGIVSEHEGQIWADSKPGAGARFYLQIPLSSAGGPVEEQVIEGG
jgi:signal transduction histidine kinase